MKRLSRGRGGQVAMVDAILFMTLMLIASGVMVGSSEFMESDDSGYGVLQIYTGDFAEVFLQMEVTGLNYVNSTGDTVALGDSGISAAKALCDEMLLSGTGGNFTEYENCILAAGSLLIRPGAGFAVSCSPVAIFISNLAPTEEKMPLNRCASLHSYLAGEGLEIEITVFVWVI